MGEIGAEKMRLPLWVRRPRLLWEGARVDRDHPALEKIEGLHPAEKFVWGILPHAARSFSPCIVALPGSIALPTAVGYLYCRVLDTYEDLVVDVDASQSALRGLPVRLRALREGSQVGDHPPLSYSCTDSRDEAHALLAREVHRLDALYTGFDNDVQQVLLDLVVDMADGMGLASTLIADQRGALVDGRQLSQYCKAVLGNPIRFAARLFQWSSGRGISLSSDTERAACDVGELLQLANITRDIEKDLQRGVCYHPALTAQAKAKEVLDSVAVEAVRSSLCDRALALAPSYLALVEGMRLRGGLMSASALMMLRFTVQHYRKMARMVGVAASPASAAIWAAWPAILSADWAHAQIAQTVEELRLLRADLPVQAPSMYLS